MSPTYLVDTSAWIEYLRATGSDTNAFVRQLLVDGARVAVTEPIIGELLAGAKNPSDLQYLESLVNGLPVVAVDHTVDYHSLAKIYRELRIRGRTVRKLFDCLIAAVALRTDVVLVHSDRDFTHIAATFPRLRVQRHNGS